MKTIKEDLLETYSIDELKHIVEQGCVNGTAQAHMYYYDTIKWHDEFEEEIWGMIYSDSEEQGVNCIELIASFNGSKDVGGIDQFKNLLCWYAIEKIAYQIVEKQGQTK